MRCADDVNVYVETRRVEERALDDLKKCLKKGLRLKGNEDRSWARFTSSNGLSGKPGRLCRNTEIGGVKWTKNDRQQTDKPDRTTPFFPFIRIKWHPPSTKSTPNCLC